MAVICTPGLCYYCYLPLLVRDDDVDDDNDNDNDKQTRKQEFDCYLSTK